MMIAPPACSCPRRLCSGPARLQREKSLRQRFVHPPPAATTKPLGVRLQFLSEQQGGGQAQQQQPGEDPFAQKTYQDGLLDRLLIGLMTQTLIDEVTCNVRYM